MLKLNLSIELCKIPLAGGVYGAGAGVGYGASGTGIIKSQRVTLFSS